MEIYVRISGRVQGVGYRRWVSKNALMLGVHGWVRNNKDGSVEAAFSGNEWQVDQILSACEKGPMFAKVTKLEKLDPAGLPDIPDNQFKII